jgi:drug/metabolite transporter (DMT)-like permease
MGVSPIFVRLADVGPFASAFWRVALALPVLYAWMKLGEGAGAPAAAPFGRSTILAGLAFAGDLFFWHLSIVTTSVANATLFATTAPIWVVLFGWLLLRQRASPAVLVGLGLCIAGGGALLARSFQLRPGGAVGDLYGLVTGIFFGLYFLAVRAARAANSAAQVLFESTAIASRNITSDENAAACFAWLILGEPVTIVQAAGGLAILLGIWVARPRR